MKSNATNDRPTFKLIVRAEQSDVPATVRLRRLLKTLKRAYGFICREVSEIQQTGPAVALPASPGSTGDAQATIDGP